MKRIKKKKLISKHGGIFMVEVEVEEEPLVVLPADDCKNLILGWTIHEEIGECVISKSVYNKLNSYKLIRTSLIE